MDRKLSVGLALLSLMAVMGVGDAVAQGPAPAADQVVYSSDESGLFQLHAMRVDGTSQHRVAATEGDTFENALACNGRIATVVEVPGTNFHRIWTLNLDGSGLVRLTDGPGDHMPTWRPDGFEIAFSSDPPDVDIHLIRADGTGRTRVTSDPTAEYWPHWSPDAGLWAIHYGPRNGPSDIYTVTPDGSSYRRITTTGDATHPRWGPGGATLVYTRLQGRDADIWTVDAATGATRPLITGPTYDQQATWFPDGSRILFVRGSETSGDADIWSARADGTDLRNLTASPGVRELWPATACLSPEQPTPTAVPTPTRPPPDAPQCVCDWIRRRVPSGDIEDALANPDDYYGWMQPRNPSLAPGPSNPPRMCLSLQNRGTPYHPIHNRLIWRAGCP